MTTVAEPAAVTEPTGVAEIPSGVIARRATRGAVALILRTGGGIALHVIGGVALARLLSPRDFGLYAILMLIVNLLAAIGDGGVGAGLVQQERPPTTRDVRTVFTFQLTVAAALFLAVLVASPVVARIWGGTADIVLLIRMAALSFIITTLRLVPTMRLERSLQFGRLGALGLAESAIFNVAAVWLAASGWGVQSLAWALIIKVTLGTVLAFGFSPWRPGFAWSTGTLSGLLRFGLPYQGVAVISFVKDSINPLFIGTFAGIVAVGYVGWANLVASSAVLGMMALQKLYLPVYARLAGDPARLAKALSRTILACNAIVVPVAVTILVLITAIVDLVYGGQWRPAIPVFYFLWLANLIVPTVTPLFGLMSALGRPRFAFAMSVVWMASTWIFGLILIPRFGVLGFAAANALVQLTNFVLIRQAKRLVRIRILQAMWRPWLAGAGQAALLVVALELGWCRGLSGLITVVLGGVACYAVAMVGLARQETRAFWEQVKR